MQDSNYGIQVRITEEHTPEARQRVTKTDLEQIKTQNHSQSLTVTVLATERCLHETESHGYRGCS